MLFIRVMSKVMLLIFLSFAVAINANGTVNELGSIVMCPVLDKIHQAASLMTHVECNKTSCGVSTDKPAFYANGLYWILSTSAITASSENEAALKAQHIAQGVTVMLSDIAMGNLCIYYVGSSDQANDEMIGMVAWSLANPYQISLIHSLLRMK